MSIATEITRLQGAKASLKTAIEAKGVTVSSSALLDAYPALVDSIQSGSPQEKLLNFYDYDGTLVASYEGTEVQALTALPDAPDHSTDEVPLTFDEWNWTLAEIKAYNTANPNAEIIVGANYHSTDGKIHIFYNITSTDEIGVYIQLDSTGYSELDTIDWGDNSGIQTFTSRVATHNYQTSGLFHCIITSNTRGVYDFGGGQNRAYPSKINKVIFPSTITLCNGTFRRCSSLEAVVIPSGVTISGSAFSECYSLSTIIIPHGNTSLPQGSIYYNYSLRILSLPNTITSIEAQVSDSALEILTIPSSVTSFPSYGFYQISSLKKLTIPTGFTSLDGGIFMDCKTLNSISLPNSITSIGDSAFKNCHSLQTIKLPNSLATIANAAFNSCYSLQSITIPDGVTSIGNTCFASCNSLSVVIVLATTPPTLANSNAFSTSYQKKFYVPYSADHSILNAYKTASNWSTYASYMEELPE